MVFLTPLPLILEKNRYARFVELDARNIFKKKIESNAYSYVNKWPKQDWFIFRAKTIRQGPGSNPEVVG